MERDLTKKAKARARKVLSDKSGWVCYYCKKKLVPDDCRENPLYVNFIGEFVSPKPPYDFPEIDHLIPRIRGGGNNIENLVLSCGVCNHTKNKKTEQEYKRWIG